MNGEAVISVWVHDEANRHTTFRYGRYDSIPNAVELAVQEFQKQFPESTITLVKAKVDG